MWFTPNVLKLQKTSPVKTFTWQTPYWICGSTCTSVCKRRLLLWVYFFLCVLSLCKEGKKSKQCVNEVSLFSYGCLLGPSRRIETHSPQSPDPAMSPDNTPHRPFTKKEQATGRVNGDIHFNDKAIKKCFICWMYAARPTRAKWSISSI